MPLKLPNGSVKKEKEQEKESEQGREEGGNKRRHAKKGDERMIWGGRRKRGRHEKGGI